MVHRALHASARILGIGLGFGLSLGPAAAPAATPDATVGDDAAVTALGTAFGASQPMAAHADKVVDYTLHATLDPDRHTVHGTGTLVWRNTSSKPVSELWLHLYLNGFKNQSSTFMRAPIGGFRGSTVPTEWGTIDVKKFRLRDVADEVAELWTRAETQRPGDDDESEARVPLPKVVLPGESITIDLEWDDKLPTIVERTGFDGSFHMIAQWFPKVATLEADGTFAHFPFHHLGEFYADYGRFDVTLDVPERFQIGATGPTVSTETKDGRRIERHVQDDVHDFAWTAWDRFETRRERMGDVEVKILYPKGSASDAERELAAIRFALPFFGERFGPYPYGVLTLVHPPVTATEAGGMEYPTLITTGGGAPWTPEGIRVLELTTVHEFGHQYFYGLLGSNEDKWPFLDEGLNSFAEATALRAWKGAGSAIDLFGLRIGDTEAQAERARHFEHDEPVAQSAEQFERGSAYGSLVYSRTATILETLRRVYGEVAFDRALGVYARKFRFAHPTPTDLIETVRLELGTRPAENLHSALFDKAWVDFTVGSLSSRPSRKPLGIFDVDGKRETVRTAQAGAGATYEGSVLIVRRGTLSVPVIVEMVAEDGTRTRREWDGVGGAIRLPYSGASALKAVVVDPDHRVLLDDDPTNNFAKAASAASAGAPRVFERATYWAELLTSVLSP